MKKGQYDKYYGNDYQNMNPTAKARESWTDSPAEKTEQPEY
jgi:hypothetical protein